MEKTTVLCKETWSQNYVREIQRIFLPEVETVIYLVFVRLEEISVSLLQRQRFFEHV